MNVTSSNNIYDVWPSISYHLASEKVQELPVDINEWTMMTATMMETAKTTTWLLKLEEWTHHDHSARKDAQSRNLQRMKAATVAIQGPDVRHLQLHYSVCSDPLQRQRLIELLQSKPSWASITMMGMHGMLDWYAKPFLAEELEPIFQAFQTVKILNLYSCQWFRGHGLDVLCKCLSEYTHLQELRLQGWQWDRVAIDAWKEGLTTSKKTCKVRLLSLQSCSFQGDGVIQDMIQCIATQFPHLRALNVSYCQLSDENVALLAEQIQQEQEHESPLTLQHLHLGGNNCVLSSSVEAISRWLKKEDCSLIDLNLQALWVAYSEDYGLRHRPVSLSPLYESLAENRSLERFCLADNNLDDAEISQLIYSLKLRSKSLLALDVGDNPFSSEGGARSLLDFVSSRPTLQSMRFENPYLTYQVGSLIHFRIRYQWFRERIQRASSAPCLGLWSNIISLVGNEQGQPVAGGWTNPATPEDLIYSLLQSTSGETGEALIYRVAQHALLFDYQ